MKTRTCSLNTISVVVFALLHSAFAQAATCTLGTVIAAYGFAAQGSYLPGSGQSGAGASRLVAIAGTYRFSDNGTVSRAFTISNNGQVADVVDSGFFTINSNCTGEAVFNTPFGLEPIKLSIVANGNAIMFMNAVPGIFLTGRMEKQ